MNKIKSDILFTISVVCTSLAVSFLLFYFGTENFLISNYLLQREVTDGNFVLILVEILFYTAILLSLLYMLRICRKRPYTVMALLLSFFLLKNTASLEIFLTHSVAAAICFYFLITYSIGTFRAVKLRDYATALKYVTVLSFLLISITIIWLFSLVSGTVTRWPAPSLKTNIFTGSCVVSQKVDMLDPWFYRLGCDISAEEKITLLQNSPRVMEYCKWNELEPLFTQKTGRSVICADLLEGTISRPEKTHSFLNNVQKRPTQGCITDSLWSKVYKNTNREITILPKIPFSNQTDFFLEPQFKHSDSDLVYTKIFDGDEFRQGGFFIDIAAWNCADAVDTQFIQTETGVQFIKNNTVSQTILLADVDTAYSPKSFTEVYGSKSSMIEMQASVPALLTDLDINFDGKNDLGILYDTGPIENGYIFYLYNQATEKFTLATLDTDDKYFIVYDPYLDTASKVLRGWFTVTNPRRLDFYKYTYNRVTNSFDEVIHSRMLVEVEKE